MSPAADAVIQRLDAARQKWWFFTLLTTTVMAACLSLAALLVFLLSDALLRFTPVTLWVTSLSWLTLTIALIVATGRRLLRSQRSLEATARRVESEHPELGSDLINLVQLSAEVENGNRAFCAAAVDQAAAQAAHLRFERAAAKESRWHRFICCMQTPHDLAEWLVALVLLAAVAVVCHGLIPTWGSAVARMMTPWKFVPSVGTVGEIQVTPGDTKVLMGSDLKIAATIVAPPDGFTPGATLLVTPDGAEETAAAMTTGQRYRGKFRDQAAEEQELIPYHFTVPSVVTPLKYRLEIGDSQTKIYRVGVRQKPTVAEVEIIFTYPAYLGRAPETFVQKDADLEAPQYTMAELRFHPSAPVAKGHIQLGPQQFLGRVEQDGMRLVIEDLPLLDDGTFTVHLLNDAGHSDPSPRLNRIHVLPDKPPTVQLLKPPRESTSAPGAEVPVIIRAGDDHGVGCLWLEMKTQQSAAPSDLPEAAEARPSREALPDRVQEWTALQNATAVLRQHRLQLDPARIKPGQTVLVRAVARDQRVFSELGRHLGPQETASPWHAIRIAAAEDRSAAALEQLDRLHQAVWKILEKQIRARVDAALIVRKQPLTERAATATDVRTRQIEIQKASLDLAESIGQTDRPHRLAIKRALGSLALGEMLQAVRQCDGLVKLKTTEQFDQPVAGLLAVQDRIIETLRKLLDVARQAQSELLSEMPNRPGGDLPNDAQRKLQDLRNKLDEALRQQKKLVEAAEDLAKAPVEDFTQQKEQLLEALAAAEDDWSRFITELSTDLSKLPEQDFANPTTLQELVEIQTEIKMAEDALLKRTADIAVPLEQLGAEMAEEITANLEKWLPDTPDRERWSQEETLTDLGKEAPMAELPGQLEDLVGELMEEEEDLFDEMEDASSSAADSLDKGAGWDAMDGPISNMSAKGVTGNRLPNTSEIGGRSAEGRSGKSSGELVGEEAVGKGGRKTPSRLTPDPYVDGQIKDHSKDPTGGATGGGKESGQGGEGLEGPVPRSPGPRELQRLAGRQATLRNKAESIDLQFQVLNYHHTDLKKLIELMAQVERDLKAGRYQNALRRRSVLVEGLHGVKQYLEGEFQLRQDTTVNLPTDVQKEILGSMQDPSPAGWEELNRQYYERLATGGSANGQSQPEQK
jgi:hypothetical protein